MDYFSSIQIKVKKTNETLMAFTFRPNRGAGVGGNKCFWPTVPAGNN